MTLPFTTPRATCAVCGAARRPGAPRTGVQAILCDSVSCAWQLSRMPLDQKCRVCSAPLSPVQRAAGVCDDAECRAEWLVRRPMRGIEVTHWERLARARARRTRAAIRHGLSHEEAEALKLVVLPRFYGRARKPSPAHVRAFEANLRTHVKEARAILAAGTATVITEAPSEPRPQSDATRDAEAQLLIRGCTACRGFCCRNGTDHAFLSGAALAPHLARQPDESDDALVARYLSKLPRVVLPDSCVYHGPTGCTLPREMRSDTCNNFFCHSLDSVRHTFGDDEPVRVYFMHRSGRHFHGGVLVQIERRTPE